MGRVEDVPPHHRSPTRSGVSTLLIRSFLPDSGAKAFSVTNQEQQGNFFFLRVKRVNVDADVASAESVVAAPSFEMICPDLDGFLLGGYDYFLLPDRAPVRQELQMP